MTTQIQSLSTNFDHRPMLIGGELVASESGRWMESTNPADEEHLGSVPLGSVKDVDRAVEAALAAQPAWAALSGNERAAYIYALADALEERRDEILRIEVMDTGNTIRKMPSDVSNAVATMRYYAGLAYELRGQSLPATAKNVHFTLREPYGVVGRIVPFNHPIQFSASRIAAPLIAGNTLVEKPADQSPLSATILSEIVQRVLPAGVVNIVTGDGPETGNALVRHPRVKRIGFTGSVTTGMAIVRSAAEVAIKNITLELGGKNPMIVFPDADEKAVDAAVSSMNWAWSGQSCGSCSRLFLHESIYDAFLEKLVSRVAALRIGDPLSDDSEMGPVNSKGQYEKVKYYVQSGIDDGARLMTGGKRPAGDAFSRGYWIEPTIFANVTPSMRIGSEEVFGPLQSVFKWKHVDEVVEMANAVEYGLTASIWTKDLVTAITTARRVQSGYVWLNGNSAHFRGMPFGGFKNSGTGREEGLEELLSYTEEKAIHIML
jgi:betaine-aldehyde dehydrogenase